MFAIVRVIAISRSPTAEGRRSLTPNGPRLRSIANRVFVVLQILNQIIYYSGKCCPRRITPVSIADDDESDADNNPLIV